VNSYAQLNQHNFLFRFPTGFQSILAVIHMFRYNTLLFFSSMYRFRDERTRWDLPRCLFRLVEHVGHFGKLPTLFKVFFFNIYSISRRLRETPLRAKKYFFVLLCCCLYTGQRSASADIPLFFTYCYLTGWLLPFSLGQLTRADQPIYIVVVRWSRRLSRSKKKKRKLT
jgi:hypothetical protein